MITVTGYLIAADPSEADLVRQYLPDHIRLSRAEPGCLTFNVVATDDPLIWALDESFTDQAAFGAHQTRTKALIWFEKTAPLKRNFQVSGS